MANIRFTVKKVKPNKEGEMPIIAQINLDYKKYRKPIERVNKNDWNPKQQRVKKPKDDKPYNRYIEINSFLDDYQKKARDFFNDCLRYNIELDEDLIKGFFAGRDVLKKKAPKFFDAFNEFIDLKKINNAERTSTGYKTVLNFLLDFQEKMNYNISWNSIDMSFFDKLKYYSFKVRGISDNYFSKIIATLKNFMHWATEREYTTSNTYKKFSYSEKEKEVIFLTVAELMHLLNFEFKNDRLEKARDIYCFGCFTGLRISDINQLKHDHISDNYIVKKIQKTQQFEKIPLNKFALEILKRYKENPVKALPKLSAQKLNKYIKELCEIAGFKNPVTFIEYRAGKAIEVTKPKYELITSHTARKTFITNSVIFGMNIKALKGITGQKKDSTLNKYIKIAEDFKKTEMDNTWNQL
jgi:site-specific recombinase XerD